MGADNSPTARRLPDRRERLTITGWRGAIARRGPALIASKPPDFLAAAHGTVKGPIGEASFLAHRRTSVGAPCAQGNSRAGLAFVSDPAVLCLEVGR